MAKKSISHHLYRLIKRKILIRFLRWLYPINPNNRFINICGGEWYYPRWENIDYNKTADAFFIDHNLDLNKKPKLPFNDETVQIIFCSHGLYYLFEDASKSLLEECYRVLKKDGLIRLITADFNKCPSKYLMPIKDSLHDFPNLDEYSSNRVLSHYSYSKLHDMLNSIGFRNIQRTGRKVSSVPLLTKTNFDCNQGKRNEWSIYVEAVK